MNQELEAKKEYLKGYEKALRKLKRCEERIQHLRSSQLDFALKMDGMPHAHNNSDLSSYAAELDAEERQLLKQIKICGKRCRKILNAIDQLDNDDEQDILRYRYINLMKWEDICKAVGMSWRQTHRIHIRGLYNIKILHIPEQ